MNIKPFETSDLHDIHKLLTSNHWDFYLDPEIDERGIAIRNENYFSDDTNVTLVSRDENGLLQGFIHFDNVRNSDENSPSFNISVDKESRGKGVGTELVKEGIKYLFENNNAIHRIYATTREITCPCRSYLNL